MSLTDDDLRYLHAEFMPRTECEERTDKTQNDIAGMRTDMATMCQTLEAIKRIMWGIFGTGGGVLITYIVTKVLGG